MQHASVLYCQRAIRSMRVLGRTAITGLKIFSTKVRDLMAFLENYYKLKKHTHTKISKKITLVS